MYRSTQKGWVFATNFEFKQKTIEFKARRARVESLTFARQEKVKPLVFHPERAAIMTTDCI